MPVLIRFLGPGMVSNQLVKRVAPLQIGPAVTKVHDIELFAHQRGQHNRRAHPLPLADFFWLEIRSPHWPAQSQIPTTQIRFPGGWATPEALL